MQTLKSMRLHIGVFGRTNVGKSSILNRITNQEISIVSDVAGTTTDVVEKSMELLPIGPVTFLDTAGLDDITELGEKRIEKTMKVLNRIDVAVIVCEFNDNSKLCIPTQQGNCIDDCENVGRHCTVDAIIGDCEKDLIKKLDELKIPYLIVVNKCDLDAKRARSCRHSNADLLTNEIKNGSLHVSPRGGESSRSSETSYGYERGVGQNSNNSTPMFEVETNVIPKGYVHSTTPLSRISNAHISSQRTATSSLGEVNVTNHYSLSKNTIFTSAKFDEQLVFKFKEALVKLLPDDFVNSPKIVGDLVPPKSTVILVIPIDKEAPKGRIILPQVQTLRDLLDSECLSYVVKESELKQALDNLKKPPALVVTDSQAFRQVSEIVPENVPLTSFSILFARLKGDLDEFVKGAQAVEDLKDGDLVLILESCTHHAIEDDIGRVKIPNLLRKKTGKNLVIHNYAGHDFPDLKDYKLVIHCGACMTNRREVLSRILIASQNGVPITNYGVVISYCLGILPRATKIFSPKV